MDKMLQGAASQGAFGSCGSRGDIPGSAMAMDIPTPPVGNLQQEHSWLFPAGFAPLQIPPQGAKRLLLSLNPGNCGRSAGEGSAGVCFPVPSRFSDPIPAPAWKREVEEWEGIMDKPR